MLVMKLPKDQEPSAICERVKVPMICSGCIAFYKIMSSHAIFDRSDSTVRWLWYSNSGTSDGFSTTHGSAFVRLGSTIMRARANGPIMDIRPWRGETDF